MCTVMEEATRFNFYIRGKISMFVVMGNDKPTVAELRKSVQVTLDARACLPSVYFVHEHVKRNVYEYTL